MPVPNLSKFNLQSLRNLKSAIALAYKSARAITLANLALSITQGALSLLLLLFMKQAVDAVALRSVSRAIFFICCMGAVSLIQTVCRSLTEVVNEALSQAVTDHVSDILHAKSIDVDLEYYEDPQYYDTLHRAQREAPFRSVNIVTNLASLATNTFAFFAIAAIMLSFSWAIAILLLIAAIPGVMVRLKYSGRMYRWHRERTSIERQTHYLNWLLTSGSYAKEIRLFNLGDFFARRFADLRKKLRQERINLTKKKGFG